MTLNFLAVSSLVAIVGTRGVFSDWFTPGLGGAAVAVVSLLEVKLDDGCC